MYQRVLLLYIYLHLHTHTHTPCHTDVNLMLLPMSCQSTAACIQIGQIVANVKFAHIDNGSHCRRSGQSDLRPVHYNLHICCNGHAAVWQKLHRYYGICPTERTNQFPNQQTIHTLQIPLQTASFLACNKLNNSIPFRSNFFFPIYYLILLLYLLLLVPSIFLVQLFVYFYLKLSDCLFLLF